MRKKLLYASIPVALLLLGAAAFGYWVVFGTNTPAFEGERSVKIPPGSSFEAAQDSLVAAGLLERPWSFSMMASATGWGDQIKAGHYQFASGKSNRDLLDVLRRGLQAPVRITVPPGSRPRIVAEAIAGRMNFPPEDFLAALSDSSLAAELGTDTTRLFSYMLPETYFVYWLTDARAVVKKIKGEFDQFFTAEMRAAAEKRNLSVDDVLTVASIVEWETNHDPEKPRIAGVYLNRLRDGWRLDADPTIQYALLQLEGQRRRLFFKDYQLNHPYNTYKYRGLPPGPINNPSRTSIEAVVHPEAHKFMFFVALGDGTHTFTRTMSEHRRASQEFYNLMRNRRRQQAAEQQALESSGKD
ncbi:MAG: endolytic transglycosylase MltG [Rhodothermales bacterium]